MVRFSRRSPAVRIPLQDILPRPRVGDTVVLQHDKGGIKKGTHFQVDEEILRNAELDNYCYNISYIDEKIRPRQRNWFNGMSMPERWAAEERWKDKSTTRIGMVSLYYINHCTVRHCRDCRATQERRQYR